MVSYKYDSYGNIKQISGDLSLGNLNPFRYKGYYYDNESGMYYCKSRYYVAYWLIWLNMDRIEYLDNTNIGNNNHVMMIDDKGNFSWRSLLRGVGYLATGIGAIVTGSLVIASSVALAPMLAVAGITIGAGVLTTINGTAEIGEAISGYNYMKDGVFGGNSTAYNVYAGITDGLACVGSMVCGGWLKANAPRIEAYKNVGNYGFSGTLLIKKHMARPYQHSTLLQKNIIKYGEMTKESTGLYNFTINGTFKVGWVSYEIGKTGSNSITWKIVLDINKQIINHIGF